jgi:deoxyribodipyrimidine photolyase-related protein
MMEVWDEATYVKHHKQKIVLIFAAMRHFADDCAPKAGRSITWLDDPANTGSFTGEVARAVERHRPSEIRVTEASEWRVQQAMREWEGRFPCPVEILPDGRFIATHARFPRLGRGPQAPAMEFFYREMRRKTGLLMEGDKPLGGRLEPRCGKPRTAQGGIEAAPHPQIRARCHHAAR